MAKQPKPHGYSDILELRDDLPYLLGRAWAVADAICALAEGYGARPGGPADPAKAHLSNELDGTLSQLFRRPRATYPRIVKAARDRLAAAKRHDPTLATHLDDLLASIGARIGDDLPERMSAEDASKSSAGLWHQESRIAAWRLDASQRARDEAMAACKEWAQRLADDGMSEVQIAEHLGITRMTVRAALGK